MKPKMLSDIPTDSIIHTVAEALLENGVPKSCVIDLAGAVLRAIPQPMHAHDGSDRPIMLIKDTSFYAPCQLQEAGPVSEHEFWLMWLPGQYDFIEIVEPDAFIYLDEIWHTPA